MLATAAADDERGDSAGVSEPKAPISGKTHFVQPVVGMLKNNRTEQPLCLLLLSLCRKYVLISGDFEVTKGTLQGME